MKTSSEDKIQKAILIICVIILLIVIAVGSVKEQRLSSEGEDARARVEELLTQNNEMRENIKILEEQLKITKDLNARLEADTVNFDTLSKLSAEREAKIEESARENERLMALIKQLNDRISELQKEDGEAQVAATGKMEKTEESAAETMSVSPEGASASQQDAIA